MKVKDIMIKDVVTCKESDSIKTLLETLSKNKIGGVPIINEHNKLIGIVTDGDIIRFLNPNAKSAIEYYYMYYTYIPNQEDLNALIEAKSDTVIKKIMKKNVAVLHENDTFVEALSMLSRHHFKKIPVVNAEHEVVGVISRGDIIRKLSDNLLRQM